MNLPYAEDIGHYWKTSQRTPDEWMGQCRKLIEEIGGKVLAEGFGAAEGKAAFMFCFSLDGDEFKVVWPVLPSCTGDVKAARRQAATLLYHDIKAKAMTASVLGNKVAFFSYLMLPDGRAAASLAVPELSDVFPVLLRRG